MSKKTISDLLTRGILDEVSVRTINAEKRMATFVAATENGVRTWSGKEVLRVGGMDLKRYQRNPVVLDTHNRWEASSVIGSAAVKVEGRELIADIVFAKTDKAEEIWTLVKDGFLRALSVGFIATKILDVEEGAKEGEGDGMVTGPCRVITGSELYEISVVPVPADAEALRRTLEEEYETMSKETEKKDDKQTPAPVTPPIVTPPAVAHRNELAEEIEQRRLVAVGGQIRAIAPKGLEDMAEQCVIEGLSLEDARKRMLEARAKLLKPIGTPEPVTEKKEEKADDKKELTDDVLARSLGGPRAF